MRLAVISQKYSVLLILIALVVLIAGIVILQPRVRIGDVKRGTLSFSALPPAFPLENGKQQIVKLELTSAELSQLAAIVSGKMLHRDNPSCGFDANTAFILIDASGVHTFMIAEDGCGIIEEKSTGRFLYLSAQEVIKVAAIFKLHGGKPPYGI